MEASTHRVELEPEPREWRGRALTVAAKMWCGAIAFFFAAFLFAYFYLRSLDPNHGWKIGSNVSPSGGLGVAIMGVFLLSGILLWLSARRPADDISTGVFAILLALLGVGLQFFEYSTLGFGPGSGAYASVFFGWTGSYALGALWGVYWMETQVAAIWRARRNGFVDVDEDLLRDGLAACSTCWTFLVAVGVLTYLVLYLV
jgi:heme/copper-type cytochrome/quinol oxidase subunit 3